MLTSQMYDMSHSLGTGPSVLSLSHLVIIQKEQHAAFFLAQPPGFRALQIPVYPACSGELPTGFS